MSTDRPLLYSIRRLNPFEGVMQIIDAGDLRATSTDGDLWELRVRLSTGDSRGSQDVQLDGHDFGLFAFWKRSDGQLRHVTHPSMNSRLLVRAESRLRGLIDASVRSLPFALMDRYEFWALDAHNNPLALLASCCHPSQFHANETHRWQACRLTDDDFSPHGIQLLSEVPRDAANRLEHHVNRSIVHRLWFKRNEAGCGNAIADKTDWHCEPQAFPAMLLREEWDSEEMRLLVSAWIRWKSAALLTLSCLDTQQREQLERAAAYHPFNVKRHHRLYPEVLDQDRLRTTLVKARLLHSNNAAAS